MSDNSAHGARRGGGFWALLALALVIGVLGAVILAGGAWLIALGGSWYYGIAGLGLVLTAILLVRRQMAAVYLYLAVWVSTLVWAYWEVGLDLWAQVPRLVAPTLVLIAVLCAIPALSSRPTARQVPA
ncbi:glucose dehydrogenase [Acuticoccus mangrovi]|uniref:Glucose dehydrogenase n=1 Tax=Acuticoccus mangrovi TaxID=2796142 RepID=A0A934ILG7_9HYPH|nr:glucose dehydrogenase [Acuticoccus mangrovi]MBJ3774442.1 glucose dehydrogenase [Acuticoccus mangrovi]